MINFQQGDQYAIPISIKQGNTLITPDNCDDVRIKINQSMVSYQAGTVTYNAEKKVWEFPLTEELSRLFTEETPIQIGVKIGSDIFYSTVEYVDFHTSIITEDWYE